METNFENIFDKVSQNIKDLVKTETVVGDEFTMGDYTCKPVMKVGLGFGTGNGTGTDPKSKANGTGGAAGAGIGMAPIGFLISNGKEISFIPANNKNGLSAIIEKVPDIVDKFMEMKKEKESKEETKDSKKEDKKS
ncbi:MAG: GerW family sporulation protein [Bacteroidales bacterium]|nr:GerW family sporulation protein [Bacteroidales bacterium]MBN2820727.1 GerW family sporulation protein [Bacteroidales bacterium]